ncbi:REJ domain protein (macronuclear) [Tetrahymena thermophila SB210]|uniref:REJ domain protein n=1 Tax=Tetrahymena thermophila (strain SB210) TaxID=312017 RepID=Q23JU3_TETTS|nr:REJ domain protein [Tetrahymena thermophila SB210]EAR96767.2 REJ domain protein [Tetrahymena thermophila SB210]|eukprot:XP_001017012.2 REJ domain protein [Tetrahymena thermophila SB210]
MQIFIGILLALKIVQAQDCSFLLQKTQPTTTPLGYSCKINTSVNFSDAQIQDTTKYKLRAANFYGNVTGAIVSIRQPTCDNLIQTNDQNYQSINFEINGDSTLQYINNIYISFNLYSPIKPVLLNFTSSWNSQAQQTLSLNVSDYPRDQPPTCHYFRVQNVFANIDLTSLTNKFSSSSILITRFLDQTNMALIWVSNLQVLIYYKCPIGCMGDCPSGNCQSCQSGYDLISGSCVLKCGQRQYSKVVDASSQQTCQPCLTNCNLCSNGSTCTNCDSGYTYAVVNGSNQCYPSCTQPNQYIDPQGNCQNCMQYCSNCSTATYCTACFTGFILNANNSSCQCNGYINNNQCLPCTSPCQTCTDSSISSCQSCINNYYLVKDYPNQSQSQCLQICPNNYQLINNTCKLCIQTIYNSCFNCPSTCRSCSPSQTNKCQDCYPGMQLNSNNLCEPSPQPGLQVDSRNLNFYYCSQNNIAVVQATFSSSSPTLTLEFGINLVPIPGLQCNQIFDAVTLNLLGSSTCSINLSQIIVTLSQDANLMVNQVITITTTAQILQFQGVSSKIDTIYLISYVQQPVTPQVNVLYNQVVNSCNDIQFQIQTPQNDAGRGFLNIKWILSNPQNFSQTVMLTLLDIITTANDNQNFTLFIPKQTIPANTDISIKISYTLKVSQSNTLSFTTTYQQKKQIFISQIQNNYPPIYRYIDLQITYFFTIQSCDLNGIQYFQDQIEIQITSSALPSLNKSLTKFNEPQILLEVQPYAIPASINLDIQVSVQISSDASISNTNTLSVPYTVTQLQTLIQNGSDMLVNYKNNLTLIGLARDYEIQDPNTSQGIQLSWHCRSLQVQNGDNQCYTYKKEVYVPQNTQNITIDGGTFNPYQILSFTIQGSKDSRTSQYSSLIIFAETDLPPLLVVFDDPRQLQQININEDIHATLIYGSNVPSDILTYAGAILYNNLVVGVIKFDYYKLKFRIWDYFSDIKADNIIVQIRFTVYNPANIMPSLSVTNFNINLAPSNCVLSVTPSSGQALTTQFTIQFNGCVALNNPITYQLFYYNQTSDALKEIQIPQNILRRQLQDQSLQSKIITNLPSGNIVIMGQAMDSYLAVFNTTIQVNVSPFQGDEQTLLSLIGSALSQQNIKVNQMLINLCIIGEEITKNTALYNLDSINFRKQMLVQSIISYSNRLQSNSFLSTYGNKVVAALQASINNNYQTQSYKVLDYVNTTLQNSQQKIANQNNNNKLFNNNDIVLQNLIDCFKMLNSTTQEASQDSFKSLSSNQTMLQQQMDLSDQIGNLLNKITLPNQGDLQLQGNLISISTEQITSKNLQKYMFIQNQPSQNDSNIYNVVLTNYSNNPFINTEGFQSYINQLQNTTPGIQVSINSVVKPFIQNTNNATVSQEFNNSLSLQFSNIKPSKYNLTCLQQQSQSNWTQSDCKLIQSTLIGSYTCVCKNQNPTTIIENLKDLLDNKNLKTAFGSQGIQNISNFTTFYEYAIFWILSSVTLIQIGLCIYGHLLDFKNQITFVGSMSKINPISLANFENFDQKVTDKQNQLQLNLQKQESDKLQQKESTVFINYLQSKQESQRATQSNINLKRPEYDYQGSKLFIQQQENDINNQKVQNLLSLPDNQSIQSLYLTSKDNKQEQKLDQPNIITENKKTNNIEDKGKQNKEEQKDIVEILKGSKNTQKLMETSLLKKILIFHNFSSIFFVYSILLALKIVQAQDCSFLLQKTQPTTAPLGYSCKINTSTTFDAAKIQDTTTYKLRAASFNGDFANARVNIRQPSCDNLIQTNDSNYQNINFEINGDSMLQYINNIYISFNLYTPIKPVGLNFTSSWNSQAQQTLSLNVSDYPRDQPTGCHNFRVQNVFANIDLTSLTNKYSSSSILITRFEQDNSVAFIWLSNLQVLIYYKCPIGCMGDCPSGNCQSCQSGYDLIRGSCVLKCGQRQYSKVVDASSQQTCQPCLTHCNVCTNGNTCTNCDSGYTYAFVNGSFQCYPSCIQPSQYIDPQGNCQNCMQYCSNCDTATFCTACFTGFTLNVNHASCQCNGYINNNQCLPCTSPCQTCTDSSISNCQSCINNYYPVINQPNQSQFQCLQICPNNYQLINNTCKLCIQTIYNSCFNCPSTCRSCSPSQINKCQDCYPGMQLNSNNLCEPSPQPGLQVDSRNLNFYYCSQNNIAVVQATFSSSSPTLTLELGINLVPIPGLQCNQIFDAVTLNLLGSSTCSISLSQIIVTLSQDANLMVNQVITITTTAQILQFQGVSSKIDTIYLISYVQQPVTPQVNVLYNQVVNSCNDIQFQIQTPQNDAGRGFLNIKWILSNPQNFSQIVMLTLLDIITKANDNQSFTLFIPKQTIPANTDISIKISYILKVSQSNTLSFTTTYQQKKQIFISQIQNNYPPIYRYMDLQITYFFTIQSCDLNGIQFFQDQIEIQITSSALASLNKSLTKFNDQQILLEVQPYAIPPSTNLDIQVSVQISSDASISNTNTLSVPYTVTQLQILIQNGSDMLVNYKNNLTLIGLARDYEIQDPNTSQGIQLSWHCRSLQVQNGDNQCYTYKKEVYVPQNTQNITIDGGTFNPYQILSFTIQGSKDSRTSQYSSLIIFAETDLPPLLVVFDDPRQLQQININEDIHATLIYGSNVPSDILTYAGAILYNNLVVGVIKFDYYKLKFRIWDYFSDIKADNIIVQIRFTVYNPANIMPSLSVTNFNINLPPSNCVLSVTPSSGQALTTQFTIQFNGCVALNNPITYQLFYYNQTSDVQKEIQIPQNILRRQLQDQSLQSKIITNLPSGNIVIMGQAMDSYLAVFNTTIQVNVSPFQGDEQTLLSLIGSALSQQNIKVNQMLINLCIIGEELTKNTTLYNLDSINFRKQMLVQSIISYSNRLSSNSFLSTYGNKVIAALQASINNNYQTQSYKVLDYVSTTLQNSQQKIANQNNNNKLFNNNDIVLQNLIDCFKILNSTTQEASQTLQQQSNNNGKRLLKNQEDYSNILDSFRSLSSNQTMLQQQMNLSDQIGNLLNKITLPNQGDLQLQGNLISINTEQITSKNLQKYMFIQNQPSQNDSNIYNVVLTNYSYNPFINTEGFQSYINQLQNTTPGIQISINSVVKPFIQNINNATSQEFNNSLSLQFSNIKPSKYNLTCLQQNSQSKWTQSDCKLIQSTLSGSYTCVCKNQNPTTIAEDLQDLLDNKNLKTAFGSQGIQNISNFTTFYEYAVFWILSSVTLIQIGLCIYGHLLDSKNKITFVGSMSKINPISLANFENFDQKITNEQNQLQLNQQKQESDKLQQKESTVFINYLQLRQQSQRGTQSNINLKIPENDYQGSKLFIQQQQNDINNQKVQNLQSLSENQSIQSIYLSSKDNKQELKFGQPNIITEQAKDIKAKNIEDKSKQSKEQQKDIVEILKGSKNTKKLMQTSLLKKILIFHNFSSIFFVYSSQESRALRFSIFYLRVIHSLSISTIFDQQYNEEQIIIVSLINSVILIASVTLIRFLYKSRKIFKMVAFLVMMGLLVLYYYIILSIVSGQSNDFSNKRISSFFIIFGVDFLILSTLISIINIYAFIKIVKNAIKNKYILKLLSLLQIQDILENLAL